MTPTIKLRDYIEARREREARREGAWEAAAEGIVAGVFLLAVFLAWAAL